VFPNSQSSDEPEIVCTDSEEKEVNTTVEYYIFQYTQLLNVFEGVITIFLIYLKTEHLSVSVFRKYARYVKTNFPERILHTMPAFVEMGINFIRHALHFTNVMFLKL